MPRKPNYTPEEKAIIATNLKRWREEAGMTQDQVAKRVDVQTTSISRYENASSSPDSRAAASLTHLFGYSVEDLKKRNPIQRERRLTKADATRIAEAIASGELDVIEADGRQFYVPHGLTVADLAQIADRLKKK